MKTVDAKGQKCPMPLILTKRALIGMEENETLEILIDNEISLKNVSRFLTEHHMPIDTVQEGGVYRLLVNKAGDITEKTQVEEYCESPLPQRDDYIIAFQKEKLGVGPDELCTKLMVGFINTLPDLDHKPTSLVFLTSGIFLTLKGSPVLESLHKLEKAGVQVLVCGSCIEYFQKTEELGAGIISNMYTVLDQMTRASKVLYP